MTLYVKEANNTKVTLQVKFVEYKRLDQGTNRAATVSGATLLAALQKMVDNMLLYIDSDQIEEEGWTAEEVLDEIEMSNGDGCDYIYFLKNLTTGEVYIDEGEPEGKEDWDD